MLIQEREKNNIRFVKVTTDYEKILGNYNDRDRVITVENWTKEIEKIEEDFYSNDYSIAIVNQKELEDFSTLDSKYVNGNWGARYFRSPNIYHKIIKAGKGKLLPLRNFIDVKYGIKTGANDFFYLVDETDKARSLPNDRYKLQFGIQRDADIESHKRIWEKFGWFYSEMNQQHYLIERFYTAPIFKSQHEAKNLEVDLSRLNYRVILCKDGKNKLSKFKNKILKYIEEAEDRDINKVPSVQGRPYWYDLTSLARIGEFIFPSKIGERFRLIDNRESQVFCDKVNYVMEIREEYKDYSDILFLILNSISFRFLVDLFARQMVVKVSDVDVSVVDRTLILNPILLKTKISELNSILKSLKSREQETIFEEIKQDDKRKLDYLIFEAIGLSAKEVDELYFEAAKYVQDRKDKSDSLITKKTKGKLTSEDALNLIQERFSEIRSYASLIENVETNQFVIPDWEAKYPKGDIGSDNLFGHYDIYFKQANKQQKISFSNPAQIDLFRFLNEKLDIKGIRISLPVDIYDCNEIQNILRDDFENYFPQINSLLKSHRIKSNAVSIYRKILLA